MLLLRQIKPHPGCNESIKFKTLVHPESALVNQNYIFTIIFYCHLHSILKLADDKKSAIHKIDTLTKTR